MNSYPGIELNIPEQDPQYEASFSTQIKDVEKWVSEFPLANVGETARLTYKAILELNHTALSNKNRLEILESLRQPVLFINESLNKYIKGSFFPLPDKNRKIANLLIEINSEMAKAYKIIVKHILDNGDTRPDVGILSKAIYRAISSLYIILIAAYKTYRPVPEKIWKDLHQLYFAAEKNNLLSSPIKDTAGIHEKNNTIKSIYSLTLLLSTACPYQFTQYEIENLITLIDKWPDKGNITGLEPTDSAVDNFIISLYKDDQPVHRGYYKGPQDENCRLLDTSGLVNTLIASSDLSANRTDSTKNISARLLRNLMFAWGHTPKRAFPRKPIDTRVKVTAGLTAIHHLITTEYSHDTGNDPKHDLGNFYTRSEFSSRPVKAVSDPGMDIWDPVYLSAYYMNPPDEEITVSKKAVDYHSQTGSAINESAGGYRILWVCDNNSLARNGELVGIQSTDDHKKNVWDICVIRWIQSIGSPELEIGLQIIAPDAKPVALIHSDKASQQEKHHRGLLTPAVKSIDLPDTLITSSYLFHPGDIIQLRTFNDQSMVQLNNILESTEGFTRFTFTPVIPDDQDKAPFETAISNDFEELWSSL